jgi:hypothetical protein
MRREAAQRLATQLETDYPDNFVHCAEAWQPNGPQLADGTRDVIMVTMQGDIELALRSFHGYEVVVVTE